LAFLELHALSSCWAGFKFWAGFKPAIAQQASAAFPRLESSQAEVVRGGERVTQKSPARFPPGLAAQSFQVTLSCMSRVTKSRQNFSVAEFLLAYASWRSEKTAKKTITTITKQSAW
jgi:hypothetical protein